MKQNITTCLEIEFINEIKKNGWKYNDIMKLGIIAKKENPQMINRIREMEQKQAVLVKKVSVYAQKVYDLEMILKKHGINNIENEDAN